MFSPVFGFLVDNIASGEMKFYTSNTKTTKDVHAGVALIDSRIKRTAKLKANGRFTLILGYGLCSLLRTLL